jgi:hypothetical protein
MGNSRAVESCPGGQKWKEAKYFQDLKVDDGSHGDCSVPRCRPSDRIGKVDEVWLISSLLGVTTSQKSSVTQIANLVP